MQPPMNEYLQQALGEAGFKVELEVLEWNALVAASSWRQGPFVARGTVAVCYSYFIQGSVHRLHAPRAVRTHAPKGTNWGYYGDKAMDAAAEGQEHLRQDGPGQGAAGGACQVCQRRCSST